MWSWIERQKNTAIFGLKIFNQLITQKNTWHAKLKFGHNVGAYECFMQTELGGASSRDQNFTDGSFHLRLPNAL